MVGKDDALRLDRGLVDSGIGGCLCNAEAEVLIWGEKRRQHQSTAPLEFRISSNAPKICLS